MRTFGMWLRWSWRDLRGQWARVAAIALIIALGTGAYAGLSSNARWRKLSADHNYALLNMYDLRARLSTGSQTAEGALVGILAGIDHADSIEAAEERLILPTQVDASTAEETILVRGLVVGVPVSEGGPRINLVHAARGRGLLPADSGANVAMLETNFATFYELPPSGEVRVSGGREIEYVGYGTTPEYFMVQPETGGFFSQANYAVLFTSLTTAQQLAGEPGVVNDLVITLEPSADPGLLAAEIEDAFAAELPEIGIALTAAEDDITRRSLYEDIEGDQQFFNVFAFMIFAGAVAAAFNLITRQVEATRREMGIGMALGVPRMHIALRPLLVGSQIALLGVVLGLAMGWIITVFTKGVLESLLPLPEWQTPLQADLFFQAAVVGFAVPLLATVIPVWRAVRVAPVEAIRTGHLAARGSGFSPLIQKLHLPGDTFAKMPFRNLLRAPRRSVLTILGIAAAVSVLVALVGAIDSFLASVDRGAQVTTAGVPDRIIVDFDRVYPTASPPVQGVIGGATVRAAEPYLQVGGALINGETEFDALIQFVDFDEGLFVPPLTAGRPPDGGATIILSEKAADDLGVEVGDTVRLRHPVREGLAAFSFEESAYRVAGLHDHPLRSLSYMAGSEAEPMGLDGLVNAVTVLPAPEAEVGDVQRELFEDPAVASVQRADAQAKIMRDFLDRFVSLFQMFEGVALLLAVLIALNSAGLGLEERRREHATMFAYGVRAWKAVRIMVVESLSVGVLATLLGVAGGMGMLWLYLNVLAAEEMPDLGFDMVLSPASIVLIVVVGVVAVGLAPLLTAPRRLRRMDVPSTLRVME